MHHPRPSARRFPTVSLACCALAVGSFLIASPEAVAQPQTNTGRLQAVPQTGRTAIVPPATNSGRGVATPGSRNFGPALPTTPPRTPYAGGQRSPSSGYGRAPYGYGRGYPYGQRDPRRFGYGAGYGFGGAVIVGPGYGYGPGFGPVPPVDYVGPGGYGASHGPWSSYDYVGPGGYGTGTQAWPPPNAVYYPNGRDNPGVTNTGPVVIDDPAATVVPLPTPTSAESHAKSLRFREQGDKWFRDQNYTQAYLSYKSAYNVAKDVPENYFRLGFALVAHSRYDMAVQKFTRGLQIDPQYPAHPIELLDLLGDDNKAARDSITDRVLRYANEDLHDPQRLFLLGMVLHKSRPDQARTFFEGAAALGGAAPHLSVFLNRPAVGVGAPIATDATPAPEAPGPFPALPAPDPKLPLDAGVVPDDGSGEQPLPLPGATPPDSDADDRSAGPVLIPRVD